MGQVSSNSPGWGRPGSGGAAIASAGDLEQELARRLLILVASLALLAEGFFLLANLRAGLRAEIIVNATLLAATAWAWIFGRRGGRDRLGVRLIAWSAFAALSAGLLRQGGTGGPAVWWLSCVPLLLLQVGALRDGGLMTTLVVLEVVFAAPLILALHMPLVDLERLGSWRRDLAMAGALTLNALVLYLGSRWRHELLLRLDEARTRAESASQMKSSFLANMSHEIRTPLHGVIGAAELLRGTRLDDGQRHVLSVLRRSSAALLSLVDDVLDFSKLEAGRMRVEHERFDLHDAVHDAAEVFSAQAEAKGVDLLSHCAAGLPASCMGDAARLRQILHNLVGNAVKFTERGEVRVFAAPEPGADGTPWVRIAVRDTGIGMTEEQTSRLFEAFAQADVSTTRRFGGTGLGLSIARELAALLGGRIEVQSQPGVGSSFMLLLPLTDAASAPAQPPSLAGVEVIVASASRSRREDIAELVTRASGHCSTVPSWPALAPRPPARRRVVVFDARLPERDGQGAAALADHLAASGDRGVLLVDQATDARALPRELVPLYRPARPQRVMDALRHALAPPSLESARVELDGTAATDGTGGLRVLLVEDNLVNQLVAQSMLERLGATVLLAGDGQQALHLLDTQTLDLVLMDCQMPVLDGLECTRRWRAIEVREGRSRTRVVAMTAGGDAEARKACLAAGMDDFLSKPVDQRQLAALLARVVQATAG